MEKIRELVQQELIEHGHTIDSFADALDISKSTLCNIIYSRIGKLQPKTLYKLVDYFGKDILKYK